MGCRTLERDGDRGNFGKEIVSLGARSKKCGRGCFVFI